MTGRHSGWNFRGMRMKNKNPICIVDDEILNLDILSDILSKEGHTVITSTNWEDGLELITKTHPSILLLDLNVSGKDTRRLIRDNFEFFKDITIIIISGFIGKMDRRELENLGVKFFFQKPIDFEKLVSTISHLDM